MKVRTARGVELDIGSIMRVEQDKVALGNAKMNARGDLIGPGGKVVKKREEVLRDYYYNNPKAVKQVGLSGVKPDKIFTPEEMVKMMDQFQTPGQPIRLPTQEEVASAEPKMNMSPSGYEAAKAEHTKKRKMVEKD
jgi:hypothetical protein